MSVAGDDRLGRRWARLAGVCGALWAVLAVTRLFLTGELDRPDWTGSPSIIVDFYRSSSFDTAFVAGVGMVALGYVLLLVFVSKVSTLVESRLRSAPWLGRAILAAATLTVVLTLAFLASFATAVFWASHGGLGDDGYLVLHGFSYASYGLSLVSDLVFGVLFGGAVLVTGLFTRWLGWAMVLTGIAEGVAWFLTPDAWDVTSGLPYLWVLIAAVTMIARPETYTDTRLPAE